MLEELDNIEQLPHILIDRDLKLLNDDTKRGTNAEQLHAVFYDTHAVDFQPSLCDLVAQRR